MFMTVPNVYSWGLTTHSISYGQFHLSVFVPLVFKHCVLTLRNILFIKLETIVHVFPCNLCLYLVSGVSTVEWYVLSAE